MTRAGGHRPGREKWRTPVRQPWWGRLAGRELEAYLTASLALAVGLLSLLDVANPAAVSAATLSILGLIVFDLFTGRRRLRRIDSAIRDLPRSLGKAGLTESVDRLITAAGPGTVLRIDEAQDIRLVGVTLSRTIRSHLHDLERRLAAGASVRVAILDPDGPGPREAARRNAVPDDALVFEHRLQPTIDLLHHLAAGPGVSGRLEVRFLRFVPAFGLTLVDPATSHGRISVDIYSHQPAGPEAVINLDAGRDPIWYRHFASEFDLIWANGQPAPIGGGRRGTDAGRA
ncbi:hypothetical protein OG792_12870 [Micromonospora sp. NBC_01699]|uniref:hypothetical protein n=1 Tax=Micromonospora sp. NBC_01699 TaxID=2975984 RepID=UPI002E31A186|nr:hypothetical protein [Micromonospora sp. NBC_01699]